MIIPCVTTYWLCRVFKSFSCSQHDRSVKWTHGYFSAVWIFSLWLIYPHVGLASSQWSDGTPITRFDKRSDCVMVSAANWKNLPKRHWAGPTIWTNRLQDWTAKNGTLTCQARNNLPCRTAHLLTYDLSDRSESFRIEVVIRLSPGSVQAGFAGFLIGAGEGRLDHRGAAMIHHSSGKGGGVLAVVETVGEGGLSFRDMAHSLTQSTFPLLDQQQTIVQNMIRLGYHRMVLNLEGIPQSGGLYTLRLSVWSQHAGKLLGARELTSMSANRLRGNIALVAHADGENVAHIFEDLKVGGDRLQFHPHRTFGPIAGTLYSLSNRTLKLGTQFMHLGEALEKKRRRLVARLEVKTTDREDPQVNVWKLIDGPRAISPPDYYLLFRVENWDVSKDWQTRVVFEDADGETYNYSTTVCHDPEEKSNVSLAAFTGMGVMGRVAHAQVPKVKGDDIIVGRWTPANVWMPFAEAVDVVAKQEVDILFFTGDQIYQGKPSPTDQSRAPYEDYLYKWLLWHWSFRELTNHLPAIVQSDDHDVYHGNIWGWGGRLCLTNNNRDGGYLFSPYFVNMVHRTQAGHNPDPYDPSPALNGISNYYCSFNYGGVGFAVLEDRKFKTPPKITNPAEQLLLGDRQLQFLKEWGQDWTNQKFKVVISQTVYAAMHVNFEGKLARDADTNGFPKVGRDRAVRLFQRCGALVISGDQHLSTFSRLGIERPSDAVYQFCVPALANIFWRWFYPNSVEDPQGEFVDAWGNYFRMIAVANPERRELLDQKLRRRYVIPKAEAKGDSGDSKRACLGDGYGVVRFDKIQQEITVECWPHNVGPTGEGQQFPGWPVKLRLADLDGRQPVAWLPDLKIEGISDPIVQIIDQESQEIIKVTRAFKGMYRPGVYDMEKTYILRVGEPHSGTLWWEGKNLQPTSKPGQEERLVVLKN